MIKYHYEAHLLGKSLQFSVLIFPSFCIKPVPTFHAPLLLILFQPISWIAFHIGSLSHFHTPTGTYTFNLFVVLFSTLSKLPHSAPIPFTPRPHLTHFHCFPYPTSLSHLFLLRSSFSSTPLVDCCALYQVHVFNGYIRDGRICWFFVSF